MGKRKARAFTQAQKDAADWDRARTETRPAVSDVVAPGIGLRRMQLVVCPSFCEASAWEVRQLQGDWSLFRSQVVTPWPNLMLRGYERLSIDSATLSEFFARIIKLSLPISPDLSGTGGADGTIWQLAAFGDIFSEWRFQWWSRPPARWKRLGEIAMEMAQVFSSAEPVRSTES